MITMHQHAHTCMVVTITSSQARTSYTCDDNIMAYFQVYSLVTDEELKRCSRHINGDADLSILADYLCTPAETTTSPPRQALSMLTSWKKQQQPQAFKKKLIDILTASGRGFEKAARWLVYLNIG